jgi:hypothetical protein
LGSWDAGFNKITARVRERLLQIVHGPGKHECVPIQGSGTFAVEATIGTLVPHNGHVLVPQNGAYCQRIAKICRVPGRTLTRTQAWPTRKGCRKPSAASPTPRPTRYRGRNRAGDDTPRRETRATRHESRHRSHQDCVNGLPARPGVRPGQVRFSPASAITGAENSIGSSPAAAPPRSRCGSPPARRYRCLPRVDR